MNALATIEAKPLAPQSMDEARTALVGLFAGYDAPFGDKDKELMNARVSAYLLGLQGVPGWAVEQAVVDFLQGKIERKRKGTLPNVEELATQARLNLDAEAKRQEFERRRIAATPVRFERVPFMEKLERIKAKYVGWQRIRDDVSYDQYWAMIRSGEIPRTATWVPALNGAVLLPPEAQHLG